MGKKLPSVFQNKIDKKINNNETVAYGDRNKEMKEEKKQNNAELENMNVKQKITKIFNSSNYIYKANVKIKLKDKEITKKIIGKNNKNIITIDNEVIPIDDIIDINFI